VREEIKKTRERVETIFCMEIKIKFVRTCKEKLNCGGYCPNSLLSVNICFFHLQLSINFMSVLFPGILFSTLLLCQSFGSWYCQCPMTSMILGLTWVCQYCFQIAFWNYVKYVVVILFFLNMWLNCLCFFTLNVLQIKFHVGPSTTLCRT
jgi:hypothetical protein